ncbi:hypothetical protein KFK09_004203 [Dendrobium nobile]|uniref:Uncharacterized protein n=1 Tax=Dendrobium nobile TaxID=94219 RepID=A0A8T3C4Q6_DENNO|nr:hypothetical protein KFK09_004203 [Dendrobium nobile]
MYWRIFPPYFKNIPLAQPVFNFPPIFYIFTPGSKFQLIAAKAFPCCLVITLSNAAFHYQASRRKEM